MEHRVHIATKNPSQYVHHIQVPQSKSMCSFAGDELADMSFRLGVASQNLTLIISCVARPSGVGHMLTVSTPQLRHPNSTSRILQALNIRPIAVQPTA